MTDLSVKRTLVKSPPELWSEVSEVESLARHLGELGEIRISRIEPEHTVAWEGERASGTVEIEASGWGTKVTLTAEVDSRQSTVDSQQPEPEPVLEPEPEPEPEPSPSMRLPPVMASSQPGLFSRWFFKQRTSPSPWRPLRSPSRPGLPSRSPSSSRPSPSPSRSRSRADREEILALLESTLDSLGSAHHRPFSRG